MKTKYTINNTLKGAMSGILFLTVAGLSSCNFLDFDQSTGYDSQAEVFEQFERAERSLTQVYTYLDHDFGSIGGGMRDCAIDDAHYVWSNSEVHTFNNGNWSALHPVDDAWSSNYKGIRAANLFIQSMEEADFERYKWNADYETWTEKSQYWVSEARFLRSLFLFELARRYGDIPMPVDELYTVDNINTLGKTSFINTLGKTSFQDVMSYIANECKEISGVLPNSYEDVAGKQTGRITKGAALALRSRALLYAASPLYSEDNQQKWIDAAKAAKEVMDLGLYQLVNEDVVNNLSSKELILERRMASSCDFEKKNFPISFDKGNTGTCPSQNLVDAFQTENGDDVILTENGFESDDPDFDETKPYTGRDPRFYKTVLYDGAMFKNVQLDCSEGGAEGLPTVGASETGYYLRKYVMDVVDLSPVEKPAIHCWVLFRYAEILLNYAEAMNNAYGPNKTEGEFTVTALAALNQVRTRYGMPAIELSDIPDKQAFQEKLEREKRVEFAFENQRFWDLRRWKKGSEVSNGIDGVRITLDANGKKVYTRVKVENRTWDDKMYFYPIPMSELLKNNNLYPQNPGWN